VSGTLFRNALIVTMDHQRRIIQGDLLVESDYIKKIGRLSDLEQQADQVINCDGKVLIPGFIQTHIHLVQALFRGQADDLALLDWLRKKNLAVRSCP